VEFHPAGREDLRAALELVYVHVDAATHRPQPLPAALRDALRPEGPPLAP